MPAEQPYHGTRNFGVTKSHHVFNCPCRYCAIFDETIQCHQQPLRYSVTIRDTHAHINENNNENDNYDGKAALENCVFFCPFHHAPASFRYRYRTPSAARLSLSFSLSLNNPMVGNVILSLKSSCAILPPPLDEVI